MITYKVSYVVIGGEHPGAIVNEIERPVVGGRIQIGRNMFEIVEIHEVMPPRGDFAFLHATVRLVNEGTELPEADTGSPTTA
ncbi:MAG: hypothetical protein JXJ20_15405 [Anaerolineae bacterium]|jgi:hypothetical protein|nr:hypothetical protein [Anaerolineae bacterium]